MFNIEKISSHEHEEIYTDIFITIFFNSEKTANKNLPIVQLWYIYNMECYTELDKSVCSDVELFVTYICKLKTVKFCLILTLWSQLC